MEKFKANTVCITRYNKQTLGERNKWLLNNPKYKCIYKSPIAIKSSIPYETRLFVLEMNNDTNQIIGIGIIVNEVRMDRGYQVYEDGNYNRYTYLGSERIDRSEIMKSKQNVIVIETLERLLFYGPRHSKRGQGIHELPKHILRNKFGFSFTGYFSHMFHEILQRNRFIEKGRLKLMKYKNDKNNVEHVQQY